jgi:hypothetical protein
MRKVIIICCLLIGTEASARMSRAQIERRVKIASATAGAQSSRARRETVGDEIVSLSNSKPSVISRPEATYIAPHFASVTLGEGDQLKVRSPKDGGRSWVYTKKNLPKSASGFWGIAIPGDRALLELTNTSGSAQYTVDRYGAGLSKEKVVNRNLPTFGMLEICGNDDSQEASCYADHHAEMFAKSNAVTRLLINGQFACTGWLLGPDGFMLTNEHCIHDADDALNVSVEVKAQGDSCDVDCNEPFACPGTLVATSTELIKVSRKLDYALVKLPDPVDPEIGFLTLRCSGPKKGEPIYIPQHPRGVGKRLVWESTEAEDQAGDPSGVAHINQLDAPACNGGTEREVGYRADTDPGASGSPVIAAADNTVVALHHCGGCPNRGIAIDRIVKDLGPKLPHGACAR